METLANKNSGTGALNPVELTTKRIFTDMAHLKRKSYLDSDDVVKILHRTNAKRILGTMNPLYNKFVENIIGDLLVKEAKEIQKIGVSDQALYEKSFAKKVDVFSDKRVASAINTVNADVAKNLINFISDSYNVLQNKEKILQVISILPIKHKSDLYHALYFGKEIVEIGSKCASIDANMPEIAKVLQKISEFSKDMEFLTSTYRQDMKIINKSIQESEETGQNAE